MNKAVVNFILKYNKGVVETTVAASAPGLTTFKQAQTAVGQAVNAAQQIQQVKNYLTMSANNLAKEANRTNMTVNNKAKLLNAINRQLRTIPRYTPRHDLLSKAKSKLQMKNYARMSSNNLAKEVNRTNLTLNNKARLRNAINAKQRTLNKTSPQYDLLNSLKIKLNNKPFGSVSFPPPRPAPKKGITGSVPVPIFAPTTGKVNAPSAGPVRNANMVFLQGLQPNKGVSNTNYERVIRISMNSKNPAVRSAANGVLNKIISSKRGKGRVNNSWMNRV